MAEEEAKKRVHKEIQDKVMPLADNAFKGIAKAVPELAKAMKKVDDAVKKSEPSDLLQTYRRELAIKLRAVNDARQWALEALEALKTATADDASRRPRRSWTPWPSSRSSRPMRSRRPRCSGSRPTSSPKCRRRSRALEDIAKQAGIKGTGKELVEKLKKAKLL